MTSIAVTRVKTGPHHAAAQRAPGRRGVLSLALAGLLLALVYALAMPGGEARLWIANGAFTLTSILAAVLCLRARRRLGASGLPWLLFGLGCGAWFLGQMVWNVYELVLSRPVPYPSLADVGFGLRFPLFVAGLIVLIRQRARRIAVAELVLDSLIVVAAGSALAWELVIEPVVDARGLSYAALATSLVWEVEAAVVLFLGAVVIVARADLFGRGQLAALLGGMAGILVSNGIYGRIALEQDYATGGPIDICWHAGFILIGVAATIATRGDEAQSALDVSAARTAALTRVALMVIGTLAVSTTTAWAALEDERDAILAVMALLSGVLLAVRIGYAIFQADLLSRRTRERDRLEGVVSASAAVAGTLELEQLLPRLAESAAAAVGSSCAEVYVFQTNGHGVESYAHFHAVDGVAPPSQALLDVPVGVFPAEKRVLATHAPTEQRLSDPGMLPHFVEEFRAMRKLCTLVAPLLAHGRVVGVFELWSPGDEKSFAADDVAAAAAIGQQAGLAIHNARLLERTRRFADEQAALLRVSQVSVSTLDLASLLREIARASLGVASAEACAIEIWRPEHGVAELAAEATIEDWPDTAEVGARYALADWPSTARVLTTRRPLSLLVDGPELTEYERAAYADGGTNAVLVVPLVLGDACLGVMNFYSRELVRFSADDVRIGQELAAQVALAIDRARLHEAVRAQADTDGLTGVLNHRAVLEALDREISRASRTGSPLAVLMIDLDAFKQINDRWGHQVGDQALRQAATALRAGIREVDVAGRYGGDEFLLILPDTDAAGARRLALRLAQRAAEQRVPTRGEPLTLELSAGIAVMPEDGATRQELIAAADARMYETKAVRR